MKLYIEVNSDGIKKLLNIELTWEDEYKIIEI